MATGLGKTILSALDVQKVRPNRMLFVAHRQEILQQAMGAFSQFMKEKHYGYYGGGTKEQDCEFMFAMIQTLGKKKELEKFDKHMKVTNNINMDLKEELEKFQRRVLHVRRVLSNDEITSF